MRPDALEKTGPPPQILRLRRLRCHGIRKGGNAAPYSFIRSGRGCSILPHPGPEFSIPHIFYAILKQAEAGCPAPGVWHCGIFHALSQVCAFFLQGSIRRRPAFRFHAGRVDGAAWGRARAATLVKRCCFHDVIVVYGGKRVARSLCSFHNGGYHGCRTDSAGERPRSGQAG